MSVKSAGMDWSTMQHKIMLGDKQIGKIYVGDKLVYPSNPVFFHVTEGHFKLVYESEWVDGIYDTRVGYRDCQLPSRCTCDYDIYLYFSVPTTIIVVPDEYEEEVRLCGGQTLYTFSFEYNIAAFNGHSYFYEFETGDCSGKSQRYATFITGKRYFTYYKAPGAATSPSQLVTYKKNYDYLHASYYICSENGPYDLAFEDLVKKDFFPKHNVNANIIRRKTFAPSNEVIGSQTQDRIRKCTDNSGSSIIEPSDYIDGSGSHPLSNKTSITDIRTIMQTPYGMDANGNRVDSLADCKRKCAYLFSSGTVNDTDKSYDRSGPGGTGMGPDRFYFRPLSESQEFISKQEQVLGYHQDHIWKRCNITFTRMR